MQYPEIPPLVNNDASQKLFSENFSRKPFVFNHNLHCHDLLSIPALQRLADSMSKGGRPRGYLMLPEQPQGLRWGSPEFQKALKEAFGNIEVSKMRMKLSSIHTEPGYGELLSRCARELSDVTGVVNFSRRYRDPLATLFIASPNEITYFFDSEVNLLLQIHGTKTIYIFDGNDRELLEWREIEEYWHGHGNIKLREGFQSRAMRFDLHPGMGVHNPVHFPHWVQNGPYPSVALSLGFPQVDDPVDVRTSITFSAKSEWHRRPPAKTNVLTAPRSRWSPAPVRCGEC